MEKYQRMIPKNYFSTYVSRKSLCRTDRRIILSFFSEKRSGYFCNSNKYLFYRSILWTLFYQCYRGLQRIGYFLAGLENPNLQLNPSLVTQGLTASMLSPKKTVHSIGR